MKTYEWNGEEWYCNINSLWFRLMKKIFYPMGWFSTERNAQGQSYHKSKSFKEIWKRVRRDGLLESITPLTILGNLTIQPWGGNVKTKKGYWGFTWFKHHGRKIYRSPDGTPRSADYWLYGTPQEIREAAELRGMRKKLDWDLYKS